VQVNRCRVRLKSGDEISWKGKSKDLEGEDKEAVKPGADG
jgi:hypothetical protein